MNKLSLGIGSVGIAMWTYLFFTGYDPTGLDCFLYLMLLAIWVKD